MKLELKDNTHFKVNMYAWLLSHPLQLTIIYFLWAGIYQYTNSISGVSFNEIITYYFIIHFISSTLSSAYSVNFYVWTDVNEGGIDKFLCRPIDYINTILAKSFVKPGIDAIFAIPALISLVFISNNEISFIQLSIFSFSLFLALCILVEIQKCIGFLSLWFEKVFGIRDIIFSLMTLLSGQLIPLSFLPEKISSIALYTPFASIFNAPTSQLINFNQQSSIDMIYLQIFWLLFFYFTSRTIWKLGRPRYASLGG